jgi:predicted O-methyltransferase YrrM
MNDHEIVGVPTVLEAIYRDTRAAGFAMASEPKTGSLLRSLAASKPRGSFLELGTGTGVGTAWILAGMDPDSRLVTLDIDANAVQIAQRHLGQDPRLTFQIMDGAAFLERSAPCEFDFIYADASPGKFTHLDLALSLLRIGGIYFVDRPAAAGVMAGRTRAEGSSAYRGFGTTSRVCLDSIHLGLGAHDGCANECRLTSSSGREEAGVVCL